MRIAILTDLHANLESTTRILEECRRLSVDRFACLGDTVGYGADPNATCDLVRSTCDVALLGNHDAAAVGRLDEKFHHDAAREAVAWTRERLSAVNVAWLKSLPYTWREGEVAWCHGAPGDPEGFEYLFAVEQARVLAPLFAEVDVRAEGPLVDEPPLCTFIGHSHLQRVWAYGGGDVDELRTDNLELRKGFRYLVSVASGGQPRDYDPRAGFAIYDREARAVEFHRVEYDAAVAARKIAEAGLSPNFARRLLVGM